MLLVVLVFAIYMGFVCTICVLYYRYMIVLVYYEQLCKFQCNITH